MNLVNRTELFKRLQKKNPNPQTELNFSSNFELLVAVMLSAQATDISVNKATQFLFKKANTPEKIKALGEAGLKVYIQSIGLFNTKAKHIIQTCQILIERYKSIVPNNREALESLPGVGRKTANVILNTAFGEHTIAVDTHIFRLANRLNLAKGTTPLAVEKKLLKAIPSQYLRHAHHWLILHGRYICTARKPHCRECPVADLCTYEDKVS